MAVGEQLQNMVLGVLGPSGVLGGPWGYGVEAACCPSERCRHAEWCAAKQFLTSAYPRASGVGCWAKKLAWFEMEQGCLVSYRSLAASAAAARYWPHSCSELVRVLLWIRSNPTLSKPRVLRRQTACQSQFLCSAIQVRTSTSPARK